MSAFARATSTRKATMQYTVTCASRGFSHLVPLTRSFAFTIGLRARHLRLTNEHKINHHGRTVYIDGIDSEHSNWMRYINSPRCREEQNLVAFQYNGSVYYRVFQPVEADGELLVWYGTEYGRELGVVNSTRSSRKTMKMKPTFLSSSRPNPYIF